MRYNSEKMRKDLITKRCIDNNLSMDLASKQIGISKATLSRIEKGSIPLVHSFGLICSWLGVEPNKYFTKN
jgi:transcriptional regulator with XRE-family HTH domain